VLVLAVAVAVSSCGSGTTGATNDSAIETTTLSTTTTEPPVVGALTGPGVGRVPTPQDPLRVTLVGDSTMWDASPGITAGLESTGVVKVQDRSIIGLNLTHGMRNVFGGDIDWRHEFVRIVDETNPDVVITGFGLIDSWAVDLGGQTPAELESSMREAIALLGSRGARIVELGVLASVDGAEKPNPKPFGRYANPVLRSIAAFSGGSVMFVDSDPLIAPEHRAVYELPGLIGPERVRKTDLTHICPAGAARLAMGLRNAIATAWPLPPPAPDWNTGPWTLDDRYSLPPTACTATLPGQGL
jgi:hypothetical protein